MASKLPVDEDGKLITYAWPGGYPILYLDCEDNVMCPACAQEALAGGGMIPLAYFVHYEGAPEYCSDCNEMVESAYGDPDEEKSDGR